MIEMERRPTVDAIIEKDNRIVIIKRANEPFKEFLALPGGHLEGKESVEEAVVREAFEETSLNVEPVEILGVYSDPKRSPEHTIAVVFITKLISGNLKPGDDAEEANWFDLGEIDFSEIAFDHAKMIKDYIKWKSKKGTYWSGK